MKNYFIFDLDGTLYRFDDGKSNSFRNSGIFTELTRNRLSFVAKKFNLGVIVRVVGDCPFIFRRI